MRKKDCETLSGDDGLKDIFQLLKEQCEEMEIQVIQVIQDGMRQNTPITVKTSVGEATEALDSLLNTHKCLLQSGVEINKTLEFHSTSRKIGNFPKTQVSISGRYP